MIVDVKTALDSQNLWLMCHKLARRYPSLRLQSLGKSHSGTDIPHFSMGEGSASTLIVGTHHALEWITGLLLLQFIEEFAGRCENGGTLGGFRCRSILESRRYDIIPVLNVDGVDIVRHGAPLGQAFAFQAPRDVSLSRVWQANAAGVDLNHNYDAGFELGKAFERASGITGPGPTRFSGERPHSEPEVRALVKLIEQNPPACVLAYHAQGEEIYWSYGQRTHPRAQTMAEIFAALSGYRPATPSGMAAGGRRKDRGIERVGPPPFSKAVGRGQNPGPLCLLPQIYRRNLQLLLIAPLLLS